MRRLHKLVALATKGDFSSIVSKLRWHLSRLREQLWSDKRAVVLRRDLSQAIEHPKAPVKFSIRPYRPSDAATLFDLSSRKDQIEREKLESWIEQGLKTCYVAALADRRPIYIQWLCKPSENRSLDAIFGGALPVIEPDTVLLEGAYTPPRLRRMLVMPAAMARLAEEGRHFGARWAIVSVGEDNASMIKAAEWAGFRPWRLRRVRRRLFRRFVSHSELHENPELR